MFHQQQQIYINGKNRLKDVPLIQNKEGKICTTGTSASYKLDSQVTTQSIK